MSNVHNTVCTAKIRILSCFTESHMKYAIYRLGTVGTVTSMSVVLLSHTLLSDNTMRESLDYRLKAVDTCLLS